MLHVFTELLTAPEPDVQVVEAAFRWGSVHDSNVAVRAVRVPHAPATVLAAARCHEDPLVRRAWVVRDGTNVDVAFVAAETDMSVLSAVAQSCSDVDVLLHLFDQVGDQLLSVLPSRPLPHPVACAVLRQLTGAFGLRTETQQARIVSFVQSHLDAFRVVVEEHAAANVTVDVTLLEQVLRHCVSDMALLVLAVEGLSTSPEGVAVLGYGQSGRWLVDTVELPVDLIDRLLDCGVDDRMRFVLRCLRDRCVGIDPLARVVELVAASSSNEELEKLWSVVVATKAVDVVPIAQAVLSNVAAGPGLVSKAALFFVPNVALGSLVAQTFGDDVLVAVAADQPKGAAVLLSQARCPDVARVAYCQVRMARNGQLFSALVSEGFVDRANVTLCPWPVLRSSLSKPVWGWVGEVLVERFGSDVSSWELFGTLEERFTGSFDELLSLVTVSLDRACGGVVEPVR